MDVPAPGDAPQAEKIEKLSNLFLGYSTEAYKLPET